MATADVTISRREDWVLANPWPYAVAGLMGCALALATTRLLGPDYHFLRGLFFIVGLAGSGISLVLRLNSAQPPYLDQLGPQLRTNVLRVLGAVYAATALALTVGLVMSMLGHPWIPFRWGSLLVTWIVAAPISAHAAGACWRAGRSDIPFPWAHEAALLLVLAGLSCVLACWSLYFGREQRYDWMQMRLFLSVAAFVAFVSAPLFLVGQAARRALISLLVLLHFGGICTAALGPQPSPWLIHHIWTRIYRPYLEFMYLNNAYHFYAPEPDAMSYLWFRLIYEDGQGKTHGIWRKIPELDEDGWHQHTVGLEYQRHLSLTENIHQGSRSNPNLFDLNVNPLAPSKDEDWIATWYMVPAMKSRWRQSDIVVAFKTLKKQIDEGKPVAKGIGKGNEGILGVPDADKPPGPQPVVLNPMDHPEAYPFHPLVPMSQQFSPPSDFVFRLLRSYARHVAHTTESEGPDWQLKSVKIYKVRHSIIPDDQIRQRVDPQDPLLYQPYFMGEYLPDGQIKDPEDPLLFWMLPITRRDMSDPRSLTADFARRHAGDEKWASTVNAEGRRRWFKPTRATFE